MAHAMLGAQVRPYRDYLTPALHRRFNKAGFYTLLLCYFMAVWTGEWDSPFWMWFPVGPAGARTLLIFIPALTVYVLRVATWHVGSRQTLTPFETAKKYTLRKSNLLTLIFYVFSAWLYSEIYIFSRTTREGLGRTEMGREYERIKLNERSFFLRYLFLMLGIAQSSVHIFHDYDKIDVAAMKPKEERNGGAETTHIRRALRPREVLIKQLPAMARTSGFYMAATFLLASVAYFVGLRRVLWEYWYICHRWFLSLSRTSRPTGLAPFMPLVSGFAMQGTLLVLLWSFVNKAFDLYIAQEPLKNDKPITNDSKDPNGTLLNGLKSKKDAVKAIAFCELALITDAFPERRNTIYSETHRKKADTFQQVTAICLAEIKYLLDRLSIGLDPTYAPNLTPIDKPQPPLSVDLVPRIAEPLKEDKMITAPPAKPVTRWEKVGSVVTDIAKSQSASSKSEEALGRKYLKKGANYAQEGAQKTEQKFTSWWDRMVNTPFGRIFRHSFQRSTRLVVLGAPYSRFSLICNAITALTNLAVFSLKDDALGRFHEGVPDILRVFTAAITKLDAYIASAPIHPTDHETLQKPEVERRKVPEVEEVRECLRGGLEKILGSFNEFLGAMGMSKVEILDAKKAIGAKTPEMTQSSSK